LRKAPLHESAFSAGLVDGFAVLATMVCGIDGHNSPVVRHHREDQKMKRKIDAAKVGKKLANPPYADIAKKLGKSSSKSVLDGLQHGPRERLEDRVAALEIIAGFLMAEMSDDQRRLIEWELERLRKSK
jgi:hypothetical protein